MSKTFLLADDIHIKKKNFASLFSFCEPRGIAFVFDKEASLSKSAYGKYEECTEALADEKAIINSIPEKELYSFRHRNISVFEVARAEMLSYLASLKNWQKGHFGENAYDIFDKALKENKEDLMLNMAAALHWIEYWYHRTKNTPRLAYVGIFSGSLSYAKALIEIMKYRQGRVFVFESFFTGKHYYCEEKYGPIANLSDIRHKTVLASIALESDQILFDSKKREVLNIIANMKNKNVSQPPSTGKRITKGAKTLLVLGQVLNDFSLLEVDKVGISSLAIYDDVISAVLSKTDYEIIFKAHPWEHKKHNLHTSMTLQFLSDRHKTSRVHFVEDHALNDLFDEACAVLTINSQSGIEAALRGFKPITLGEAFYGYNGFTHDVARSDINREIPLLLSSPDKLRLNIKEYDSLMSFLVRVIDRWLIAESGGNSERRLKEIFYEVAGVKSLNTVNKIIQTPKTVAVSSSSQKGGNAIRKKIKKLIRDPESFFRDARFPPLRIVSEIVRKGKNAK